MKKTLLRITLVVLGIFTLTACGKKEEKKVQTETYSVKKPTTVVSKSTEGIDFSIGILPEMSEGFTRLMEDAELGNTANQYDFTTYEELDDYLILLERGVIDIATMPLSDAIGLYNEGKVRISVLSINGYLENDLGVTVVNREFSMAYPSALKVFVEEMDYSAKDAVCIKGKEMQEKILEYLGEDMDFELGEDFFDPYFIEPEEVLEDLPEEEPDAIFPDFEGGNE